MVKKKCLFHGEGGGGIPFAISGQSAGLLHLREKNETNLLEADVDTVSVIEDGKSSLNRCSYKGVLMAVRVPATAHLPSSGRTTEAAWNPK